MALPPKTIESMERMAKRLETWANDRKRHAMLCRGLAGLGCRASLSEPLRGFGTILLKLKCWRPAAAEDVEKEHRRLLSSAKEIDQEIKKGQRGLFFAASAPQVIANLLAKKLRTVAEMAREDSSLAGPKGRPRSGTESSKPVSIDKRFAFGRGQVLFDGRDLKVRTGVTLDILQILVNNFRRVVPFRELNEDSREKDASEKIRTAIRHLRKTLSSAKIPAKIENRKGDGYLMRPTTK